MHGEHRPGAERNRQCSAIEATPLAPAARQRERDRDDDERESDAPDRDRKRMRVRESHERSAERNAYDCKNEDERGVHFLHNTQIAPRMYFCGFLRTSSRIACASLDSLFKRSYNVSSVS